MLGITGGDSELEALGNRIRALTRFHDRKAAPAVLDAYTQRLGPEVKHGVPRTAVSNPVATTPTGSKGRNAASEASVPPIGAGCSRATIAKVAKRAAMVAR